ncbi:voltage-gated potassium channel [Aliiruegeria haliotis]|uniref:Voltage-gated potassium channel n=1 Tax=Aliiruegeria haliotis TaxID=1280846 RepID=A0A2T0RPJ7_9RHOB|nr:potassium channel family protein [Aliiruegeria haliotis]PRY23098.1 voltage-gated potassium channel [Aliiruegeria haliotis]
MSNSLKSKVVDLYTGQSSRSVRFRYTLILFDLATVLYFIVTTPLPHGQGLLIVNMLLLVVILLDFIARFWIADDKVSHLCRLYVIADLLVLLSFPLNAITHVDLTFLRILRGVRLGHSEYLLRDLRRDFPVFRLREDALVALLNLVIFVFVITSAVFVFFVDADRSVSGYIDAIYYTVTTLTTTGYGDLTPKTPGAKLFAVGIMVVGVGLFLRLASVIFTPSKVHHRCGHCGLTRHDPDAIHCKHCGEAVRIETKGFG